jgi:hypothetical protein
MDGVHKALRAGMRNYCAILVEHRKGRDCWNDLKVNGRPICKKKKTSQRNRES